MLQFCEAEAKKVLEEVAASDDSLVGFGALMVLREWDKGTLKIP